MINIVDSKTGKKLSFYHSIDARQFLDMNRDWKMEGSASPVTTKPQVKPVEKLTDDQVDELKILLKKNRRSQKEVCYMFGVSEIQDIPAASWNSLIKAIERG